MIGTLSPMAPLSGRFDGLNCLSALTNLMMAALERVGSVVKLSACCMRC